MRSWLFWWCCYTHIYPWLCHAKGALEVSGADRRYRLRSEGQSPCPPLDCPTWGRYEIQAEKWGTVTMASTWLSRFRMTTLFPIRYRYQLDLEMKLNYLVRFPCYTNMSKVRKLTYGLLFVWSEKIDLRTLSVWSEKMKRQSRLMAPYLCEVRKSTYGQINVLFLCLFTPRWY